MRRLPFVGLMLMVGLRLTGCASTEEWRIWRQHPTHFASGEHLTFSIRNTEGSEPHVMRHDFLLARDQTWWGRPIMVSQEQIIER